MRGIECEEWEEGERKRRERGREEGRESSRTIGGEKEKREKRATSPRERGGREGCLLVIRQNDSERERVREPERESLYIFDGAACHDCVCVCVSPECEAR